MIIMTKPKQEKKYMLVQTIFCVTVFALLGVHYNTTGTTAFIVAVALGVVLGLYVLYIVIQLSK